MISRNLFNSNGLQLELATFVSSDRSKFVSCEDLPPDQCRVGLSVVTSPGPRLALVLVLGKDSAGAGHGSRPGPISLSSEM